MATRGTAVIIENGTVKASTEFNGDMYPSGYGDKFMQGLSEVKDSSDFDKFITAFNDMNFGYKNVLDESYSISLQNVTNHENVISVLAIYNHIYSDWVFIKNLESKSVKFQVIDENRDFKNILIKPGEVFRVQSGIFVDQGKGHRMKQN